MQIDDLGEFELIERIRSHVEHRSGGTVIGIGDDAAALSPTPGNLLLSTCDCQVEGRHFLRHQIGAERLGRRLAAVNLSDIAAMGGNPRWALVSLVLPAGLDVEFIDDLYTGLVAELGRFHARIVGGNISSGETLMLDMTLFGEVGPDQILRRAGARTGNAILVSGALGSAAAGRAVLEAGLDAEEAMPALIAHWTPEPRVREGRAIAQSGLATSMIDISDGLAAEVGHICEASGVGAVLEVAHLPVTATTHWICEQLGLDWVQLALAGGEDYQLVCTAPGMSVNGLTSLLDQETGLLLTRVGWIQDASAGRLLEWPDGRREPLASWGWKHFGQATGRGTTH